MNEYTDTALEPSGDLYAERESLKIPLVKAGPKWMVMKEAKVTVGEKGLAIGKESLYLRLASTEPDIDIEGKPVPHFELVTSPFITPFDETPESLVTAKRRLLKILDAVEGDPIAGARLNNVASWAHQLIGRRIHIQVTTTEATTDANGTVRESRNAVGGFLAK